VAKDKPDDYEAVRTIVAALESFDAKDQERILRWAREKLGLAAAAPSGLINPETRPQLEPASGAAPAAVVPAKVTDVKSFIDIKKPQSDSQFVAAVAYYYRFEAPEPQRKDSISSADLQEACRKAGRERFNRPAQTLGNAHNQGFMDKGTERGTYVLNTVGENLVAMALPDGVKASTATSSRRKLRSKPRGGKKRRR
jgi:hypothetical protein